MRARPRKPHDLFGVYDAWGPAAAFRFVAMLALIPFAVFAVWWIKDYMSGGYKAVQLAPEQAPEGAYSETARRQ